MLTQWHGKKRENVLPLTVANALIISNVEAVPNDSRNTTTSHTATLCRVEKLRSEALQERLARHLVPNLFIECLRYPY